MVQGGNGLELDSRQLQADCTTLLKCRLDDNRMECSELGSCVADSDLAGSNAMTVIDLEKHYIRKWRPKAQRGCCMAI